MILSLAQQRKLGDVYLDIGKGLILASFAGPVLSSALSFIIVSRSFFAGVILIYFGLLLSDSKQKHQEVL